MGLNITTKANFLGFYEGFSQRFTKVIGGEPSTGTTKVATGTLGPKQPVPGTPEYSELSISKPIDFGPDNALIAQIDADYRANKKVRIALQRVELRNNVVTPVGYGITFLECLITGWKGPEADGESTEAATLTVMLQPSDRKVNFTASV